MLLLFLVMYSVVPFTADYLFRRYGKEEFFRKFIHIYTGLLFFFMIQYLRIQEITIILYLALGAFFLSRRYRYIKMFDAFIGRGYGEIYFIFGLYFVAIMSLHDLKIAGASVLVLTFADGLAPFGKYLIPVRLYGKKTIGGTSVFFLISILILSFYFGFSWQMILVSVLLSLVELFLEHGLDNLFIPVSSFLLVYFFKIFLF